MIKIVLFDMDGTLLDSERFYVESNLALINKKNLNISREDILSTLGLNRELSRSLWAKFFNSYEEMLEYKKEYYEFIKEYVLDHPIAIKKGAKELIEYLKKNNILMGVCTSTSKDTAIPRLKQSGLYDYFDYVICGDELKESKPEPHIYLKPLEHFNIDKDNALIIEDSPNGLLSAFNAGVKAIWIQDISIVNEDIKKRIYKELNDLSEVIDVIEELNNKL